MPRTFQGRLTVAFVTVLALTLSLVSLLVLNRLDDYFARQQQADLSERSTTVSGYVQSLARDAVGGAPIVGADGLVHEEVVDRLNEPGLRSFITDRLGQADVIVRFGVKANLVVGLGLLASSLIIFAQTPTDGNFVAHVLPASLIAAIGMSLAYIPAMIAGTASVCDPFAPCSIGPGPAPFVWLTPLLPFIAGAGATA